MKKILSPQTIALIGASQTPGKLGFEILNNLIKFEFKGKVYPINPHASEILGQKVYPHIQKIKSAIDLAIICIPAPLVAQALRECAAKKVAGAVIISAGFKEMGAEGVAREQELAQIIAQTGIRVIGPNCLGIINPANNLNGSFAEGIPKKGNVGLISQSGAMAVAITDWACRAEVGFSKIISLGNKLDVEENELLAFLGNDTATRVVLLYLESINAGNKFMELAKKVSLEKPIVVVKSGTSEQGSKAIFSHTGSLAGSNMAITAALKQSGAIRAESVEDMFDLARAFSSQPVPAGNRIAIITNAGGPGVMATDALAGTDLALAVFETATTEKLQKSLPTAANILNPVDIIGDALADRYQSALEAVMADPNVDVVLVLLTPQVMTEKEKTANIIIEMKQKYPQKTIITSFIGGKNIEYAVSRMQEYGVPNFYPERAIRVIDSMVKYSIWRTKQNDQKKKKKVVCARGKHLDLHQEIRQEIKLQARQLNYKLTAKLLKTYQVYHPEIKLARTEDEVVRFSRQIGYPVVLKISSPEILHKTEVGGVRVDLKNESEVKKAFREIFANVSNLKLQSKVFGVLVQKMYEFGKEVIIGMKRDPSFGPLLMFGLGGIYVEVMKDVSFRVAPISLAEAEEMINEVKAVKLLKGVRGESPSDIMKLAETLLCISNLAIEFPEIKEMDINPLLVQKKGQGVVAVDTRFIIQ
jgi:acetyltransferase